MFVICKGGFALIVVFNIQLDNIIFVRFVKRNNVGTHLPRDYFVPFRPHYLLSFDEIQAGVVCLTPAQVIWTSDTRRYDMNVMNPATCSVKGLAVCNSNRWKYGDSVYCSATSRGPVYRSPFIAANHILWWGNALRVNPSL